MREESGNQGIFFQSTLEIEEIYIETTVKMYMRGFYCYIRLVEKNVYFMGDLTLSGLKVDFQRRKL